MVTDPDGVMASWQEGTVIRSWLLDLLVLALEGRSGSVADPRLRAGLR